MIPDSTLRLIVPKPFVSGLTDHMRAGWIFPDRSLVPCAITAHRDVLPEQYRERYAELMADYEEAWNESLNDLEPNEHVPWHLYDPEWSSNSTLLRELSELGYMRIGAYQHSSRLHWTSERFSRVTRGQQTIAHIRSLVRPARIPSRNSPVYSMSSLSVIALSISGTPK